MFASSVRGGKAFAAEKKKRELNSRIAKLNALKLKVPSYFDNNNFCRKYEQCFK